MGRPSDLALLNAILRQDPGTFVAKVFQTVSPGDKYVHSWHIDSVAYELKRVHRGESRRLIITQPPRSLKSISASVAYPAWCLGQDPSIRFACVSYSSELAATFARQFRAVMKSDWYRALFPGVRIEKDTESEFVTTRGGGRFAVAVGGSFTGRGADVIIIDDPIKASDAQSEITRRSVNEWFGTTLLSRLDDKERGAIILVMQRLHEDDLAGTLLRQGGWRHLDLPAIAQEDQQIAIGPNASHAFTKGEALQPERESLEILEHIKREMGSLTFSAQYLQRPIPLDGNLVKRIWIKRYDIAPPRDGGRVIQSWDIATTIGENNDWSVGTTWLALRRNYYLLDVWRGQLEFPLVRLKILELASVHRPDGILIEQAGPGLHLIQELRANPVLGVPVPIGIRPEADKVTRMAAQSARFEVGQVHLPREASWLDVYLHEILGFPNSRHDDQTDSTSQFLGWIESPWSREPTVSIFGPIIIRG